MNYNNINDNSNSSNNGKSKHDLTFLDLPNINYLFNDLFVINRCEDIKKIYFSNEYVGVFIFPHHLNAYVMLKQEDPDLAILYLEDLLAYGMTGCHITNNLIVRALLENTEPLMKQQYNKLAEYYDAKHKCDHHNSPEDEENPYHNHPEELYGWW